jgi:hypothetical protein
MTHMELRVLLTAFALGFLSTTASSPQVPVTGEKRVSSPRPLADASDVLQHLYGKVVTYEEPFLVWRGDVVGDPNVKLGLFPRFQSFLMPSELGSERDPGVALEKTLDAYHRQTSSSRFKVLTSKLGYHIVPVQAHDERGALVPVSSILDSRVAVAVQERTAGAHLRALASAVTAATGINVGLGGQGDPGGFDRLFRARPSSGFAWGVGSMVARDALVELFDRSATTFSWRLFCQASSARAEDLRCALNLSLIEVAVTGPDGQPAMRVLRFDRCGDCPPVR